MSLDRNHAARELLAFYLEAGVDAVLGETAVDRFADPAEIAPRLDEDIEGLPFVGRSGKLLDRMMAAIGLTRANSYIANIVPWRPPGNRTPTPQESAICLPFTLRQIELVDPDVLV